MPSQGIVTVPSAGRGNEDYDNDTEECKMNSDMKGEH